MGGLCLLLGVATAVAAVGVWHSGANPWRDAPYQVRAVHGVVHGPLPDESLEPAHGGAAAISPSQAFEAVRGMAGTSERPTVMFGLYSSAQPSRTDATGRQVSEYVRRPVYVVAYQHAVVPNLGGQGGPPTWVESQWDVVDASTGKPLISESGSGPAQR